MIGPTRKTYAFRFGKSAGRFAYCQSGAVAIILAIFAPVLIAFGVGVAVEVGMWYTVKVHDQAIADAGTLAGVREAIAKQGAADIQEQAACTVWHNGFGDGITPVTGTICPSYAEMQAVGVTVNSPALYDPPGAPQSLVEVILKQPFPTFAFFLPSVVIGTRAAGGIAKIPCTVLAMSDTADKSIFIQGSGTVSATQLCSNSTSTTSIDIGGGQNAIVNGDIATDGGYTTGNNSNVAGVSSLQTNLTTKFTSPYTGNVNYAPAVPSTAPIAYTPGGKPTINPDGTINTDASGNPIAYCPMDLTTTTSFSPGVYIIEGEDQHGNAFAATGGTISGGGVTFIFTSEPSGVTSACVTGGKKAGLVSIHGATVNLAAPTADVAPNCTTSSLCIPSGLLFYQDPTDADTSCIKVQVWNSNNCNTIAANSGGLLQGVSYTPATTMYFSGNSDSACFAIDALQITFIGNETSNLTTSFAGCEDVGIQTPVVESPVLTE